MASGPETRLVKKMREIARQMYGPRLVIIKYHGSEFSEAGVSDLLCCLDGVFVAAEVKAPESYGGSVQAAIEQGATLKQRAFLRRVIGAGGVCGIVASVDGFLDLLKRAETQATERDDKDMS